MLLGSRGRRRFRSYFDVVGREEALFLGFLDDVAEPPAIFEGLLHHDLVARIETEVIDRFLLLFLFIFRWLILLLFIFVLISEAILTFLRQLLLLLFVPSSLQAILLPIIFLALAIFLEQWFFLLILLVLRLEHLFRKLIKRLCHKHIIIKPQAPHINTALLLYSHLARSKVVMIIERQYWLILL